MRNFSNPQAIFYRWVVFYRSLSDRSWWKITRTAFPEKKSKHRRLLSLCSCWFCPPSDDATMFKVVLNDVTSHTAIIEEEEEDPFCLNNAFSLRHLTFLSLYNGSFLLGVGGEKWEIDCNFIISVRELS